MATKAKPSKTAAKSKSTSKPKTASKKTAIKTPKRSAR